MYGVSRSTMHSRMRDFGLSVANTCNITEDELVTLIEHKTLDFPLAGIKSMVGILRSSGYRVQRQKIAISMSRVGPVGLLLRKTL